MDHIFHFSSLYPAPYIDIVRCKGHDAVVSLSDGQDGQPKIIIAILAVKLW